MFANKKNFALALAAMSIATGSVANTLDLTFVNKDRSTVVSTTFTESYETGRLEFLDIQSNTSFYAYCVELYQDHAEAIDGSQAYSSGTFVGVQATRLQGLFSSSYAGLTNAYDRAAFQAAIWEISHETAARLDVSANAGVFSVTSLANSSATAGFIAQVNAYLDNANAYAGSDLYSLTKLSHGEFQDLLAVTPVPEPSGLALMVAGLAWCGLVVRRGAKSRV